MKCVFCGGNLQKKMVEEEVANGSDRLLIKVEAEVCVNCHEKYFPEGTVDQMIDQREIMQRRKSKLQEVGKVYQLA